MTRTAGDVRATVRGIAGASAGASGILSRTRECSTAPDMEVRQVTPAPCVEEWCHDGGSDKPHCTSRPVACASANTDRGCRVGLLLDVGKLYACIASLCCCALAEHMVTRAAVVTAVASHTSFVSLKSTPRVKHCSNVASVTQTFFQGPLIAQSTLHTQLQISR